MTITLQSGLPPLGSVLQAVEEREAQAPGPCLGGVRIARFIPGQLGPNLRLGQVRPNLSTSGPRRCRAGHARTGWASQV